MSYNFMAAVTIHSDCGAQENKDVSFRIMIFSEYTPSSGIAGSYGSFIPSFFKEYTSLVVQKVKICL